MRQHPFYQKYLKGGALNLRAREGYFDNLGMYCGMAFDVKGDIAPLCCDGDEGGLFFWSDECINELKKKSGKLRTLQLNAIACLQEIFYDLLLAKTDNMSASPGFESLGFRVNTKKRKKSWDE